MADRDEDTILSDSRFEDLTECLREGSASLESEQDWPGRQFDRLAEAGVLGWVIPEEYGGAAVSAATLVKGYERLARACLVTTFVLTQRNGACQRLAGSENESLKAELLPRLRSGELFATVGVSHLSTSRQHLRDPAVRVTLDGDAIQLDGTIPWVTGGVSADYVVTGGTCADGRQALVALPTDVAGVECLPPARLMALNASQTGPIRLEEVRLPRDRLIAGPVEGVMQAGQGGGAGSVTTSALALGAARGSTDRLGEEARQREDLQETVRSLTDEASALAADLYAAVEDPESGAGPESIRQRANSLVLRSAQAYLAACKGAGFASGHPANRAVRESMFFLVWSCPQPVLAAALREFACGFSA